MLRYSHYHKKEKKSRKKCQIFSDIVVLQLCYTLMLWRHNLTFERNERGQATTHHRHHNYVYNLLLGQKQKVCTSYIQQSNRFNCSNAQTYCSQVSTSLRVHNERGDSTVHIQCHPHPHHLDLPSPRTAIIYRRRMRWVKNSMCMWFDRRQIIQCYAHTKV